MCNWEQQQPSGSFPGLTTKPSFPMNSPLTEDLVSVVLLLTLSSVLFLYKYINIDSMIEISIMFLSNCTCF